VVERGFEPQRRSLLGGVEARSDLHALQRLFLLEALTYKGEDGHVGLGPLDEELPLVGQPDILHLVVCQNFTVTNTPMRYKEVIPLEDHDLGVGYVA